VHSAWPDNGRLWGARVSGGSWPGHGRFKITI
jgi:hypothetical protein